MPSLKCPKDHLRNKEWHRNQLRKRQDSRIPPAGTPFPLQPRPHLIPPLPHFGIDTGHVGDSVARAQHKDPKPGGVSWRPIRCARTAGKAPRPRRSETRLLSPHPTVGRGMQHCSLGSLDTPICANRGSQTRQWRLESTQQAFGTASRGREDLANLWEHPPVAATSRRSTR